MRSSLAKILLLAFIVVTHAASATSATYICESQAGSYMSFILTFDEYFDWLGQEPVDGDPTAPGGFTTSATVLVPDAGKNDGGADAELLDCRSKLRGHVLTGYVWLDITTSGELGTLSLSLVSGGAYKTLSGHGTHDGRDFFVDCQRI